jgi:hypothetical protein
MSKRSATNEGSCPSACSTCPALELVRAIVEMTEGQADIDKRSIVRPGVTLGRESRRILARLSNAEHDTRH